MDYLSVKYLHVSCVVVSIGLFVLRSTLQWRGQPWRQSGLLRRAPHWVDTVLLSSALWMVWQSGQYPFVAPWLTAKVLALLAYILLGRQALGCNTHPAQRLPFFGAALLSAGYIVGVAFTRSPSWGVMSVAGI